jgi:hypothetical protein
MGPQTLAGSRARVNGAAAATARLGSSGGAGPRPVGRVAFEILNEPTNFLGVRPAVYVHEFLAPCFSWLKANSPEVIVVSAAAVSAVGQVGLAEVRGEGWPEDVEGRFPRRQGGGSAQARVPLAARLVVEGAASAALERSVGLRSYDVRGAVTWYGRRYEPPRAGELAARALDRIRGVGPRRTIELAYVYAFGR